ncbi:hypothetical protein GIB67_032387, partial [Kingdonia uniflora]
MPVEIVVEMGSSSINEVSISGQTNESDSEVEVGLEQFSSFYGQLISYSPGSDAFREFCKAKATVGEKWGNCVEYASSTTGSGEVAKEKRRRVEPPGESGEKVTEGRSATVDDLKEVEERARLAVLHGEEDMSRMVVPLVKGIWLDIVEEKSERKKGKYQLEKELARSRIDALKEVKQLKVSHAVAMGQLQVEMRENLGEMVEVRDRLEHHLMWKGYSEEEVDAIMADIYVEEEYEEEAEVVGIVDGLDDSSCSREDDVLRCNREFAEQFDKIWEANENREDQYVKAHFKLVEVTQVVSDLTLQVEVKDATI